MNQARLRSKSFIASLGTTAVLLAGVAGTSLASGVKPATFSGANGPLVYTSYNPSNMTTTLKASTLSGTAVTVGLTAGGTPNFSADGSKVVWKESSGPNWAVKIANSDGTGVVTVVSGSTSPQPSEPSFSPDGTKIVLSYDNDLHELNAASGQTIGASNRIVDSSGAGNSASNPRYVSATKIAFVGSQPTNSCNSSMYSGVYIKDTTVAGNGTVLSNSCQSGMNRIYASDFDVSPDSQWIVFRGDATTGFIAIIKVDDTGSRITAFTSAGYSDAPSGKPIFSPDGTKIAFSKGNGVFTATFDGSAVGTPVAVTFPAGVTSPSSFSWAPASATLSATTTTTAAPTTTVAATTTTTVAKTTTSATGAYATAKPGITVTDNKVYSQPPAAVADDSAIRVLSIAQNKTMDVVTKTPAVCLPNDDELIFLSEGSCIAEVVNAKTRAVLRTVKTTVIADDISEVRVGNAIVTLAPVYFKQMSSHLDAKAKARIASIKKQVSAAGSVLVVGYSGTINGNSPENVALSRARANATVTALRLVGAQGPFAVSGVGALDPVARGKSEADQAKNRRAVIVLIP